MTHQDLCDLVDYHYWARDRMFDAIDPLTPEQFTRDLGNSFRSVRDTVAHIYAAELIWYSRWQGHAPTALMSADQFPDVATLRQAWVELEQDVRAFLAGLDEAGVAKRHALHAAERLVLGVPVLAAAPARRESCELPSRSGDDDAATAWGGAGEELRPDDVLS